MPAVVSVSFLRLIGCARKSSWYAMGRGWSGRCVCIPPLGESTGGKVWAALFLEPYIIGHEMGRAALAQGGCGSGQGSFMF